MATTQNGWTTLNGTILNRSPFPGTNIVAVPGLRTGDVAVVLLEVGRRFNLEVQRLYNPGCWGYAQPIPIPGSNIISNHGSGTAIDLNAPSFPWKLDRMNNAQKAACRKIVKDLDGVVRWGGDYASNNLDQMHFEINASEAAVKMVADKIKKGDKDMPVKLNIQGARVIAHGILGYTNANRGESSMSGDIDNRLKASWVGKDLTNELLLSAYNKDSAKQSRESLKAAYSSLNTLSIEAGLTDTQKATIRSAVDSLSTLIEE